MRFVNASYVVYNVYWLSQSFVVFDVVMLVSGVQMETRKKGWREAGRFQMVERKLYKFKYG